MQERNSKIQRPNEQQSPSPGFEKTEKRRDSEAPVTDHQNTRKDDESPDQHNNKMRSGKTSGAGEETLGIP